MYTRKKSKKIYKGGVKNKTQKIKKNEKLVDVKEIDEIAKDIVGEESTIKIPKTTVTFLVKLINGKSPEEFRKIAKENEFYIPLDEYTENKEMLLYLCREILDLAVNATRDKKKKSVSSKIITSVIDDDEELKYLFSSLSSSPLNET